MACDAVLASETARFTQVFRHVGVSPDGGAIYFLTQHLGLLKAKELTMSGRRIDAQEAEALGLVNRVLPDAELDAFVDGWARTLAAGPPIALALTKRLLNNAGSLSLEQALDEEAAAQSVNLVTRDVAEATSAFLEKREPRFEGR